MTLLTLGKKANVFHKMSKESFTVSESSPHVFVLSNQIDTYAVCDVKPSFLANATCLISHRNSYFYHIYLIFNAHLTGTDYDKRMFSSVEAAPASLCSISPVSGPGLI